MIQCNKFIHQKGDIIDNLALCVLSKLIKSSVKFPEVSKETAKQIVPKFLLDHVRRKSNPEVTLELLECLQVCMSEYPGSSGEFRLDILKLLLGTVEKREEVVCEAARCVPLVAGVGGSGKQGVSHKNAWRLQQMALVSLLHMLLNQLYQHIGCTEEVGTTPDIVELSIEPISERNILIKSQRLAAQFTSVAQFLQAMLLEEFTVAKSVAPDAILNVIEHAQRPTHVSITTTREDLAVISVLPSIQIAAIRLLEALTLCLGRNLVPKSSFICYLCSQVIVWTQQQPTDWPYAMDKPYSRTRLAAYCCLYSWLNVSGSATVMETIIEKVLPIMLTDIRTQKPTVRLRVGSRKGKGKKKQQALVTMEDRSEKLGDIGANSQLCERALLTLILLVRTATPSLKPDAYRSIMETVLSVLTELPVPYSHANCLSAIYQLLLSLCLEPHPKIAPPLAPAIATFTSGLHHPNPLVKSTCMSALSSIDKIVHPTAPTLYFPIQPEPYKSLPREAEEEEEEYSETPIKRRKIESECQVDSNMTIDLEDSSDKASIQSIHSEKTEVKNDLKLNERDSDSENIIHERKQETSSKSKAPAESAYDSNLQDFSEKGVEVDESISVSNKETDFNTFGFSDSKQIDREDKNITNTNVDEEISPVDVENRDDSNRDEAKEETSMDLNQNDKAIEDVTIAVTALDDVSDMLMDFKDEIIDVES